MSLPESQKDKARRIIAEEAQRVGLTAADVIGVSKSRRVVIARFRAMYRARKETRLSYPQLGVLFNRTHGAIIHAVKKIDALITQRVGDSS